MARFIPMEERFWRRVSKIEGGCWLWTGAMNGNGYGRISLGGRDEGVDYSHRVSYRLAKGPIPEGMEIDHLCRNRQCCNPAHLEAVPHRVNTLRGEAPNTILFRENRCINGHELTEDNVSYIRESRRGLVARCKTCRGRASAQYKAKNTKKSLGLPVLSNRGERNGAATLTDDVVAKMLAAYLAKPEPQSVIADRIGASRATICLILNNRRWKHVCPEIREEVCRIKSGGVRHPDVHQSGSTPDDGPRLVAGDDVR